MSATAFKGATAWEAQVGRLWVRIPFFRFLIVGCWPEVGWDTTDQEEERTDD